jgi:hypothetical protein
VRRKKSVSIWRRGGGEVNFKAYLAPDLRAGNVAAAKEGQGEGHAEVQLVLPSREDLKLIFAEAVVVVKGAMQVESTIPA